MAWTNPKQKTYANDFRRTYNGELYVGLKFMDTRLECKEVAKTIRKFGVKTRSVVIPASGTLRTGGMVERYLLMIVGGMSDHTWNLVSSTLELTKATE